MALHDSTLFILVKRFLNTRSHCALRCRQARCPYIDIHLEYREHELFYALKAE